jgi:glutamate racemase
MTYHSAPLTIAFVDSGIGGIPYMTHALRHIPDIRGVYLADNGFFPYGIREPEELSERLVSIVRKLREQSDPAMVVLACNTASVVALSELRSRFPIPFVGTVPAIKPAALHSRRRRIGVMATEQTLKDPYLDSLIADYAADAELPAFRPPA